MKSTEYFDKYTNGGYRHTVAMLRRCGLSADQAEEFAQAGWVHCIAYIEKIQNPGSLDYFVARAGLSLFRNEYRRSCMLCSLDLAGLFAAGGSDNEAVSEVRSVMAQIDASHAQLLWDVYVEELTYEEIAQITGATSVQLYGRAARARERLRQLITAPPALLNTHERPRALAAKSAKKISAARNQNHRAA